MTLNTREQRLAALETAEANDALFPEFAQWLTRELQKLVKAHSPRRPRAAAVSKTEVVTSDK